MVTGKKRFITLESRKSTEIGLKDLMHGGVISLNSDVEKLGLLFLTFRRNSITISAGPYVGLIPLTEDVVVDVRPKMPVSNVAHVVDRARGRLVGLDRSERLYLSESAFGAGVLDFLAGNLVKALEEVQTQGLHKEYVRENGCNSNPRGRILVAETVRKLWPSGQRHRVLTSQFVQTVDSEANRLIKTALIYYLRRANRMNLSRDMVKRVDACLQYFPSKVGEINGFDLSKVVESVETTDLGERMHYYSKPIKIASFILSGKGISLDKEGKDLSLESFIINFESIFEDYIRYTLSQLLSPDLIVRNGNTEGKKPLFDDTKDHAAQPDIVIVSPDFKHKLIVEVKYKEKPNRDDINQAVTYALSYRSRRSVLVHQRKDSGTQRIRRIGTISGIEIVAYGFDLAALDMNAEEKTSADWIRKIFLDDIAIRGA